MRSYLCIHISIYAADLTSGLNGQTLSINLGTPDNLLLRGNAFPVIVAQDGVGVMMAAARVVPDNVTEQAGGIVAFNKEAYMMQCGAEASPATAPSCRLAVNSLRWAAGIPAASTSNTTLRVAISRNAINSAQLAAIKLAAVSDERRFCTAACLIDADHVLTCIAVVCQLHTMNVCVADM